MVLLLMHTRKQEEGWGRGVLGLRVKGSRAGRACMLLLHLYTRKQEESRGLVAAGLLG